MNVTLAVWLPLWHCYGVVQLISVHACVGLTKLEHLGSEYLRHSRKIIFQMEPFPVEDLYSSLGICRSRRLLANLSSPDSPFGFFLSRPWLNRSFRLWCRSSRWNPLGRTRFFPRWPWKGCRWIPWPTCPRTASWIYPTEWLVPHQSSRGVLPDI